MAKISINPEALKTFRDTKRHKVSPGHNIFRILPPFGDAANGYPYRRWDVIWGLSDPTSGRMRPYASCRSAQDKRCPVTEYVTALQSKAERIASEMKAAGEDSQAIKNRLEGLNSLIGRIRPKTVYAYNAVDKSGVVGVLELKSTAHKKMKSEMSQYVTDYNQDPTSLGAADDDSGVWFDIIREGEKFDTKYDVTKHQMKLKTQSGKIVFEDDRSPLPDSVVQRFNEQAYDLSSLYQTKTYEELKDVLEANLPALIRLCPDADLSSELQTAPAPAPQPVVPAPTAAKGTRPVTLKLDDADEADDEEMPTPVLVNGAVPSTPVQAAVGGDFFADVDRILGNK